MLVRFLVPIAILVGGGFGYSVLSIEMEEEKRPPSKEKAIRTKVSDLRIEDYVVNVQTQGIVQSHNEITLSGQVSGQITALSPNFEVGKYFSKGEILIELDDRDYKSVLRAAQARQLSAKSARELAEVNFERTKLGHEGDSFSVVTKAEMDQAAAALSQAEADLDAATVQVDQANLNLDRTKIRAPFDGRVREKLVGLGESLNQGSPAAIIFAVDYAEVRLPIAARERQYLRLPERDEDEPVSVELRDAISPESEQRWTARIVRTEGALDVDSLELFVIARIDDPFGMQSGHPPLRIGQPVSASITGKTLQGVVVLPRAAVRQLNQVILISKSSLTLRNTSIHPIWSDNEFIIVEDTPEFSDALLSMTHIVFAPDGAKVEIIPEVTEVEPGMDVDLEQSS